MNKTYRHILDSAAGLYVPDDLNLFPRVVARLNQRRTLMQTLRARPLLAVVVVLLALLILTAAAYAIGRLTGYIPGIGFVQTDSLRILAQPVSQTREGVTVTIEQVVVDSERTVIVYKTEGLTITAANSKGEGGGPFGSPHLLQLPDGAILDETPYTGYSGTPEPLINNIRAEDGWPNYVWRLVYPPVPQQVNELTLIIPILQNMPVGAAPENWAITFHLKPVPPDMSFAPIIGLTPSPDSLTGSTPASEETGAPALSDTAALNGFTFKLEHVIELEDGFVFTGSLSWDDSVFPTGQGTISEAAIPTLTDADGRKIPIEEVQVVGAYGEHKHPWSYRTDRKLFSGPLVFSITSINTLILWETDFEFDLGSNPQIGQSWEINRDFVFAGHKLRLLSARLIDNPNPEWWVSALEFTFETDAQEVEVNVVDVIPQKPLSDVRLAGGGGGRQPEDGKVRILVGYPNIPSGMHRFPIGASAPQVISGPWQVAWNPPVVAGPTPTSEPEACLTLEEWQQLIDRNDPLPPELGGKILISVDAGVPTPMSTPAPNFPILQISSLDGTNRRDLVNGGWASLSPDGARLVYSNENGLNLLDIASGQTSVLGVDGYAPVWSPDGARILYTMGTAGLYVINADGSVSQKIDTAAAQMTQPLGWLPDNQTIIYSVYGEDYTFTLHNLQSGAKHALFPVRTKYGDGAVSPAGQWLAFVDWIFGSGTGTFVSRLDGSQRKLLVTPEISTSFRSSWSPDGKWLLVTTSDYRQADPNPIYKPVLIEPETCRVIGLPPVLGEVLGWSK